MKVLLTQPVDKLGETGEVVEVKRGYARNFLFPSKLAVEPTEHNVQGLAKAKHEREIELRNREQQAEALKAQLDGTTFTFSRTAHEEGHLYGSVRLEDIAAAIEEKTGQHIERDRVKLGHALEEVGTYEVHVNLYKDITCNVQVVVEAEGVAPQPAPAPATPAAEGAEHESSDVASGDETSGDGQEETGAEGDVVA
jgi:large subunit ribosomal protein L9